MLKETIYNLIPRKETEISKPPRHVSQFKKTAKFESDNYAGTHKTFGPAKVPLSSAKDFTKKGDLSSWKTTVAASSQTVKEDHHCSNDANTGGFSYDCDKRPNIPAREDRPIMGLRTTKSFVHTNAVENIMSVPRKPDEIYVDTRHGDKHKLKPSGLDPVYTKKKDFGKTPDYLNRRKEEVKKAQEEYEAFVQEHIRRGQMDQLSEQERQVIISGLKANWDLIHKEYQNLSVMIDTIPKKIRKERMESEMANLEKDIQLLERHRFIYITN